MKILIVEDEPLAAEKMEQMLYSHKHSFEVLAVCNSVGSAIKWINSNPAPDLGFFDIQLGDGTSFDIFDSASVTFPVIFTTAYDHYAIKAFKVNSVDYLLKPIDQDELEQAILKFEKLHRSILNSFDFKNAIQTTAKMISDRQNYKERFTVNVGEHIRLVKVIDIACFYSQEKATFLLTREGKDYCIDESLNQLESAVDPSLFFRTSRKEMVNIEYISDIINYGRSRAKITIKTPKGQKDLIISRERMKSFRKWLNEEK